MGPSRAAGGMFFIVSWRCVRNVVADIATTRMTVTQRTFEAASPNWAAFMNVADSGAPRIVALSAWAARSWVSGPRFGRGYVPFASCGSELSTRNRAKKIGDWARIGRQDENGFVPCLRYSSIVSRLMASRDAGSVLPLYFAWIFFMSGASICMPRDALICLKNSGIRMIRITITRPTMEKPHAATPAGFHGLQRRIRQTASRVPRMTPCRSRAITAYAEHDG